MNLGDKFIFNTRMGDNPFALAMVIGLVVNERGEAAAAHLSTFSMDGLRVFHNVPVDQLYPVDQASQHLTFQQPVDPTLLSTVFKQEEEKSGVHPSMKGDLEELEETPEGFGILDNIKKVVEVVEAVGNVVEVAGKTADTVHSTVDKTVSGVKGIADKFKHKKR